MTRVDDPDGASRTRDGELAVRLVAALGADRFVPSGAIAVTVHDGVATLSGAVSWDYQRAAAHETAALVPGVKGTVDTITLEPHAWQQPDRLDQHRRPSLVAKDGS